MAAGPRALARPLPVRLVQVISTSAQGSVTSYVGSGTDLLPVLREATPKVATYVLVFILTVIVTDPRSSSRRICKLIYTLLVIY